MSATNHPHRTFRSAHGTAASPVSRVTRRTRGRNMLALAFLAAGVTGTTFVAQQAEPQLPRAGADQRAEGGSAVQPVAAVPAAQAAAAVAPRVAFPSLGNTADAQQYYAQLRSQIRWAPVKVAGRQLATPDVPSRLLLAQSAAERAGLHQVGLDYRDVYGVINAETTWVPRTGMGKNGVASLGIAQFEPATARGLGLKNPNDTVEAVHAAAAHLKTAARWSARRISGLNLSPEARAAKLREGVSIYYNLSTRGRNAWNGLNTEQLPIETRRHIRNVRAGATQAEALLARVSGSRSARVMAG